MQVVSMEMQASVDIEHQAQVVVSIIPEEQEQQLLTTQDI